MSDTANPAVVVGGNVKGDITTCKREEVVINKEKWSVFSLTEKNTIQVYDVCSRQVINTYETPQLTFLGFILIFAFFLSLTLILVDKISSW